MKFRNRLLWFGFAVAGLAALAVFISGETVIRRIVTDRVTERLQVEAIVLADVLARDRLALPDPGATLEPHAETDRLADLAGRDLGLRVTIVAPDGLVLGDSSVELEQLGALENHATRPEIVEARAAGMGASTRHSVTVRDDLYYLARRIDRDGRPAGFVRLAVPVSELERTTGNYSLKLAGFGFVALLGVALIGYLVARRFSRPIEEMSLAADEIAAGRRDTAIEVGSNDEIGQLGAALNRMTRALSAQIDSLSAEKSLRDTMLDGMSEGLVVVDTDRRVLLCNHALGRLLGFQAEDLADRPLIEVTREHGIIEAFDSVLGRGERRRDVVRLDTDGGRVFELNVVPLKGPDGSLLGAVGLLFDVTRLTMLESVRREFVADVSHELRTPLTTMKSFVETLLAGGIDDKENNRRFLEIIRKNGDRMEAIIDDLTDLSLIETGSILLEPERLELAPLVKELLDSARPKAVGLQVSLVMEIPRGVGIHADRRRLEQVLLNLLENGIKFNKPGGTVTVRAATNGDAPGAVRIEIEDTGVGIPADSIERVFHRFYRVDRSRSRQMGGTGLGLSIVKHLVRLQGGTVRVESRLGEGSRFILEFPAAV
ncbi:MAG TPA: ATP-binding protein [Patescibacteria group bacterium]|nr:ATP-binding protein [Patescibacteria group bacterium]